MKLSELNEGQSGTIIKVRGYGEFRHRLNEMGFVRGQDVAVLRRAPLGDPIEYRIMGYDVSLRAAEAEMIEVSREGFAAGGTEPDGESPEAGRALSADACPGVERPLAGRHIHVALVGNPNAGKTSLFNALTDSRERVGNYSGVTVGTKEAGARHRGYTITFTDLPGTYSLSAYSKEELYVRSHILDQAPDVVLNVVDAGNLARNLYLTAQLIDMDLRVVTALNMHDELEASGAQLDRPQLASLLGIPMVPTVAHRREGIAQLLDTIVDLYEDRAAAFRHIHIGYGAEIEEAVVRMERLLAAQPELVAHRSPRYLAIRLFEGDDYIWKLAERAPGGEAILKLARDTRQLLETRYGDKPEALVANARYGFVSGALRETFRPGSGKNHERTSRIDRVLLNRALGIPIFLAFMLLMFYCTFTLGAYPMEWIEAGTAALYDLAQGSMPAGPLRDLLADGIINGVGSVLVFLPNILILFLFIAIMESSGYMARAAFIMDRAMHRFGLHGKSFIPLVMGFGCNVPAIMSTRILENRSDRLLTMLIVPFMSCSARLPVYILIISAFFPSYPALIMMAVYLTGILLAVLSAQLFKKAFFRRTEAPFVMELPPYRMPTLRAIGAYMWDKSYAYLRKIGGTILVAAVIIWALGYFPVDHEAERLRDERLAAVEMSGLEAAQRDAAVAEAEADYRSRQIEGSYLRRIGGAIEPVLATAGLDWRMSIGVVTGIVAKETFISTLSVIYQADEQAAGTRGLGARLRDNAGGPRVATVAAVALLAFMLIYFPCIGVLAAVRKETAGWRWPLFMMLYTTALAWLVATAIFQVGSRLVA